MTVQREDLGRFFGMRKDLLKKRLGKCLEPTMRCEQSPIRAHSIQNSKVLDLLVDEGHVICLAPNFSKDGPRIELKRTGRNDASTFTGLCSEHDAELFRPLDTRDLDLADREQLFLLAYRSITRELHAAMEGAMHVQMTYRSLVERGEAPADTPSVPGLMAVERMMVAHQTYVYRAKNFDADLLARNFGAIEHDYVEIGHRQPTIAVSSLFSLEELAREDHVPRVVLNVVPLSRERSVAIFSYTPDDRRRAASIIAPILNAGGDYQKFELSRLIIGRIENFVLSPAFTNSWSEAKAQAIKQAFGSTLTASDEVPNHPDMMLF